MQLDAARVIWSEGLFLRPHHFQQLERYFESLIDSRLRAAGSFQYGFLKLQIDTALLLQGKVHIAAGSGLFPDGTPFELPSDTCLITPFDVPEGTRDQTLFLSAVLRRTGAKAIAFDARDHAARRTRYVAADAKVADNVVGFDDDADLKVGALNLAVGTQDFLDGMMSSLPFARVAERRADGSVVLDNKFVPPLLDVAACPRTQSWLDELHGLVRQRADALAARIGGTGTRGVAESQDFLLLLACNRYDPLLSQLRKTSPLHPAVLFNEMLKLAGEVSSYSRESRRPPEFPAYNHTALAESIEPVFEEIRRAMVAILDQTAVQIPLRDLGKGLFGADVPDPRLVTNGFFVLAATSQLPADRLRAGFPTQVKIGPPEKIRDLVMLNLPGIKIESLQYPPRQIPFHANYLYFQLEATNPLWKPIEVSRALALYVAGDPPGLEMQMWAIRDSAAVSSR